MPEGHLLTGWLEHSDLAVVATDVELVERDAEAQRHRLRLGVDAVNHLQRIGLENLLIALEERHERDERLRRRRAALIRLQEDEHVAALAENARHTRKELLPVEHQRIGQLGRALLYGEQRFGHRDALTAQDH